MARLRCSPFLALVVVAAALAAPALAQGRVVILGVDGMDHLLTRELMEEGALPELAALAREGSFAPLRPTNPAQSPTSWATLTTGLNPGGHGIFGFLKRRAEPGGVRAEMALAGPVEQPLLTTERFLFGIVGALLAALIPFVILRRRRPRLGAVIAGSLFAVLLFGLLWLREQVPEVLLVPRNLRSGDALWTTLDREGIPVVSLGAPCAFPAPDLERGCLLCGLGVPDMLGTPGTVAVFREEPVPGGYRATKMGGREFQLRLDPASGSFEGGWIEGPRNPITGARSRVPIRFERAPEGAGLVARVQDHRVVLREGSFSEPLALRFRFGAFIEVSGLVRLRLLALDPHPVVYQEPLEFDPEHQLPQARVTSPIEFGAELARGGPFETLGWATATNPYQDGLIDDATIIADVRELVARRSAMVMDTLAQDSWRVHFSVLSTPDRVQHMFWRDRDADHPAHDPAAIAQRGDQILEIYQKVDALVGRIRRERLRPEDTLLVVSDHGFAPFHHAVNLNVWLARNGYIAARRGGALPPGARSLEDDLGELLFTEVDWTRSRAYSLGLGRIWISREGREPWGSVAPEAVDALCEEIRRKLLGWRHEGRSVVRSVRRADEIYHGARLGEAADLVVGFERGYRISWDSCLGGFDEPEIFENRTRWSGDHCSVDPELVPGVLFSSRKLEAEGATVADIYPTLRALLGLDPAPGLDGHTLWE